MYLLWSHGLAHLSIKPPPGEHVNSAAPASISVEDTVIRGHGDLSASRFPVADGNFVHVEIPFCKDDGTECRVFAASAEVGSAASGKSPFLAMGPINPPNTRLDVAVRIFDFGAEWCPPCQLMAAEVLHDPTDSALLAPFEVVAVDADAPGSWTLKSQYAVGGYPTLVAVDSQGREVDRFLGYPSEAALQSWLGGLASTTPLSRLRAGPAAGSSPSEASTVALRFARIDEADAAKLWLALADPVAQATHEARLLVDPSPSDVDWLVKNAADGDWLYDAIAAFPERFPALAPRVAGLSPGSAAGALVAYADWVEKVDSERALAARTGALALTFGQMTSDAAHNRGLIVDLTDLLAATGDLRRAIGILDQYVGLYPDEFTWDFAAARLLADEEDFAGAEPRARAALQKGNGDQRFRAVVRLAGILAEQGRATEAIPLLEAELAVPAPAADVAVRTHRYRTEAEKALDTAQKAQAAVAAPATVKHRP